MTKITYLIHEAANLFPMMSEDEFNDLVEDIRKNGQCEPIALYKNQIIDGRNRYAACQKLGIEPIVKEWDGKGSIVSHVISLNLKRRHLTSAQKAAVAVDMLPMLEAEAKERQRNHGGTAPGKSKTLPQKIEEVSQSILQGVWDFIQEFEGYYDENELVRKMKDATIEGLLKKAEAIASLNGGTKPKAMKAAILYFYDYNKKKRISG